MANRTNGAGGHNRDRLQQPAMGHKRIGINNTR
jgi:hypothetical protein